MSRYAESLVSIDISTEAVTITRKKTRGTVIQADGRYLPLYTEHFDAVVSFEVFEHIPNVEIYLKEVNRVLNRNGLYIFSTPNVDYYPMAGMNPYHVREYSCDEVIRLLETAGFRNPEVYAQIPNKPEVARIEKSRFLHFIMKTKRRFGFHGDLLPAPLRCLVMRAIAGGETGVFDPDSYSFIKDKTDESELIYVAVKS